LPYNRAFRFGALVSAGRSGIFLRHPRGGCDQQLDASHFITWKKNGWLAPFVTEDVAQYFLPGYRDPDGMFATRDLAVVDRLQQPAW